MAQNNVKRLYRSRHERMIGGVCSGIAQYFNIDPTFVRIIYILALVLTAFFPLTIAYIVLWIIIPER